jgi:acetyl esterase/lipase
LLLIGSNTWRTEDLVTMKHSHTEPVSEMNRRAAICGLGAGALGLALGRPNQSAIAQEATPAATWSSELDVVYGEVDGDPLMLDIFLPAPRAIPRPAVMLFHPGGWIDGDRTWMEDAAQGLAGAGYVAFSVGYRLFLGDANFWPAQLDDAQRSVRWVRSNAAKYGVDPERVASYGYSAGGQLAAFLGTRDTRDNADTSLAKFSSRTAAVVDLAGAMDVRIAASDPNLMTSVDYLLGGNVNTPPSEETYLDFSPITFVDEISAPFLIFQGGQDSPARIEESRAMENALIAAGIQVIYAEYPEYDHFVWDWVHTGPLTLAFLGEILRPEE